MYTYVIVGIDSKGLSKFGARNIKENDRTKVEHYYLCAGWKKVETIREHF